MTDVDIDHLQQWVGREHLADDIIDPFRAGALAAALDRDRIPATGDALPPSWHWLYFLQTPSAANTSGDGHAIHEEGFLPPAPLPRRMWAAGRLEIDRPLIIGAPARKRSVVKSIEAKKGKSGSLVFVNIEHSLSQQDRSCIREEQNLVYRPVPAGPSPLPPGETAPTAPAWRRTVTPDPVLLFRYSALTYNGHRIHYDRDYAKHTEFYPALVVHGPLLATLLLDFAIEHAGERQVVDFSFRAIRPTFDSAAFTLCGRPVADGIDLWTADDAGMIGMTAQARLAPG